MDITIQGEHAVAVIHAADDGANAVDAHALAQIQMLCDTPACAGTKIRVMPDVHAGKVGPIGLTMTVRDKAMPAIVGNDIGCGVLAVRFQAKGRLDFPKLDKVLRAQIPSGAASRPRSHALAEETGAAELVRGLRCAEHVQQERALRSLGTLGGGNHFIEVDRGDGPWLTIHSGSRNLGQQVFDWYMKAGQDALKAQGLSVPYEMTWLEGGLLADYLADMQAACKFAAINRSLMAREVMRAMKWKESPGPDGASAIDCPHNYIDSDAVLRKGAIRAAEGEPVLIPANMRDGVILGRGRGNPEWNSSAPHGAGRVLKRTDVKAAHTVAEFKREMKGIWSSCIAPGTLDEAPFAYRAIEEIQAAIGETVQVEDVLTPLYNFKAGGDRS